MSFDVYSSENSHRVISGGPGLDSWSVPGYHNSLTKFYNWRASGERTCYDPRAKYGAIEYSENKFDHKQTA